MVILRVFEQGFQTTNRRLRMMVYLWLINFIFSVLIVTPIYFLINKEYSRSLAAEHITGGMDLFWLGDIIYKYQDIFPALVGWFLIPGILFAVLSIYLNGGMIGRIAAQNEKISMANFFGDCGKYFFRFFRVFLISLLGYLIVFGVIFSIVSALFEVWTKNASSEWPLIFSSNIKFLILVLLFSIIRMFFDYVKIRLVVENSKKAVRATLFNFSFIGRRFFKTWALYLLVCLVTVILAVIYLAVYQLLPKLGFMLVVAFIWQQAYMLSKMWTKILFFSTEYHFIQAHKSSLS